MAAETIGKDRPKWDGVDLNESPGLKEKYQFGAFGLELGLDESGLVGSKHGNQRTRYALPDSPKTTTKLKTHMMKPINLKLLKSPQTT